MNKYCICFFFALALTTANAKGFSDFLNKANSVLSKVSDYSEKISKTVGITASLIDGLIKDYKIVNEDVKKLGESIKSQYNSLAQNFQKIIDVAKKFANNSYTDGKALYTSLKKQLDIIITAAENDVKVVGKSAMNTLSQINSDATILYKDGKLIAKNTTESIDLTETLKELKQKNTDKLNNAIETLNSSMDEAKKLVQSAKDALKKYKTIAEDTASDAKVKATKIVAELEAFATEAEKSLKEFVKKEEKSLESILKKVNELAKSSQSVAEQVIQVGTKVVEKVANNTQKISTGVQDISNIWKDKPTSGTDYSSDGEVSKKTSEVVNQVKEGVNNVTSTATEVAEAINSATETVQSAIDEVQTQVKNFEYVVTATKLNVRSGPGKNYKVVEIIQKGTPVKVTEFKDGFACIGEGKWVSIAYIKVNSDDASSAVNKSKTTVVNALESIKSILEMLKK